MSKHLRVISNSEAKSFRKCPRKHHYSYRLRRRRHERPMPLRFGTLVHVGLERWWQTVDIGAALATMRDSDRQIDPFELAKAEALLVGYDARWRDESLEVLAVEQEFRVPLRNPKTGAASNTFVVGGKIDAIVRDASGRVLVVEHKTSAESLTPESDYWKRLRLDAQISTYIAAAQSLGFDAVGCLYDVIGKPGIKPLKANQRRKIDETPEEYGARVLEDITKDIGGYYARAIIVRLERDQDDAAADLWATARAMREAELLERYPRHVESCIDFGRTCDYWPVCSGTASIDDDALFRTAPTAHEELSAEKKENRNGRVESAEPTSLTAPAEVGASNVALVGDERRAEDAGPGADLRERGDREVDVRSRSTEPDLDRGGQRDATPQREALPGAAELG